MKTLKRFLPDLLVVLLFAVIAFAYFFPADTEGRILYRHDSSAGRGAGEELTEYYQRTGECTRWTNALFSGMPTYQMAPSYDSQEVLNGVGKFYHLWLPENVWYVFAYLLGFYILLRAFDFRRELAVLGSLLWAFSSYFFIIIAAGHIWKVIALAYLPPMIAGIVLAYRGKYVWGFVLTGLFTALEIQANHVQMTYYYLFIVLFMVIAYLVEALRQKQMARFAKATAVCAVAAVLGVVINLSNLYHTWQYTQESMRGKSELVKKNSANQTSSGLDRDYITQWSYGIGETFSLLVPNVKGGASVPLSQNEKAMEKANPAYMGLYSQLGQYWGEQPGTAGPVYVGAFVMFLFILGCMIVKGPMKWALVAGTVFSIVLSWGKNFMGVTDFFIDYVPMYNKFRAVSSILVIAEFTIPLLAIMALKEIIDRPAVLKERAKAFYLSLGLTGGLSLLFALAPRFFFSSYVSSMEMGALQNAIPSEQLVPILMNLEDMRVAVFTSDAWRSFFIILIGVGLLWAFQAGKLTRNWLVGLLTLLCLADMWSINKRYLYDGQFVAKGSEMKPYLSPSETDKYILADKTLDFRVLNLAGNTFNENETSYWHKSIGGYHAAKLRRYQEMIEEHIQGEMGNLFKELPAAGGDMSKVDGTHFPVLNMLNTRYFIFPLQGGKTAPILNPYAGGNAWFADEVKYVDNANEEIAALHEVNPLKTAVVDKKFADIVTQTVADSTAQVTLTSYKPNELIYQVTSAQGGTVVFSEIYYPGWQAFVDDQEAPHGRANYILRAMHVPAGTHTVRFVFDPQSLHVTETVAFSALALLLLAVLFIAGQAIRNQRQKS